MAAVEEGGGGGYEKLRNYMSAASMYWPNLTDPTSAYAYSQANARALAGVGPACVASVKTHQTAPDSCSPQTAASPPAGFAFTNSSPTQTAAPASLALPPPPLTHPHSSFSLSAPGNYASPAQPTSASIQFPAHSTTSSTTPSGPKKKAQPVPGHLKDPAYFERRRRNNESARRSREARKCKEDATHLKLVYLENDNLSLRTELSMLRSELERFRILYSNAIHQQQTQIPPQQPTIQPQ